MEIAVASRSTRIHPAPLLIFQLCVGRIRCQLINFLYRPLRKKSWVRVPLDMVWLRKQYGDLQGVHMLLGQRVLLPETYSDGYQAETRAKCVFLSNNYAC